MRIINQIIFWLAVFIILLISFGKLRENYIQAFYFLAFFLPVVIATAVVFNEVLVEKYLLKKKYLIFSLYTFYLLVISLNLEMILVFTSFTLMGYYEQENMAALIRDFRLMPVVMYLIVFIYAFIGLLARMLSSQNIVKEEAYISIRSERKTRRVLCKSIIYIESMSDYVRLFTIENEKIITRETISRLGERLPMEFLRIHRSYLINIIHLTSYSKEVVIVKDKSLPISRTYKTEAINTLNNLK